MTLEELGAGASLLWHRVVELPGGSERKGRGASLSLPAAAFLPRQPGPQFGSSGLQSLRVVVKVVHGQGGCVVGLGCLMTAKASAEKSPWGKKGLECTMTAIKWSVRL